MTQAGSGREQRNRLLGRGARSSGSKPYPWSLRALLTIMVGMALGPAGCNPAPVLDPSPMSVDSGFLPQVASADFPLDLSPGGSVRLTDGQFEEPPVAGAATRLKVWLDDPIASGDLDGDGDADAAVVLVADPGGSGTFRYLVAVLNESGRARPLAPLLLGDRVGIESLGIESGVISLTLLDRASAEPLTDPPTLRLPLTFRLREGALVQDE